MNRFHKEARMLGIVELSSDVSVTVNLSFSIMVFMSLNSVSLSDMAASEGQTCCPDRSEDR